MAPASRIDQVQLQRGRSAGPGASPPSATLPPPARTRSASSRKRRPTPTRCREAKGEAEPHPAGAEGYKEQTVAEATGQAARFLKVYEEYKKAPEVTRQRLFLEMQERVLSGTDKIILDSKGGQGVVPFLPLDQLQQQ